MNTSIKNFLLAIGFACFFGQYASAQVTFTSWVHAPQITLYASVTGAGIATSASVNLDDIYSSVIPMGFTFNYFGIPYTQCIIGANGTISFDTTLHDGYDPWDINAPLLGNANKYNSICGPWCDMDVVYTGTVDGEVTYFTYGTAPNRQFVANYCHNSMFSCSAQFTTTQMILYESTNVIEAHIAHKDTCDAWNGAYAIVGVQSDSAVDNEAWRFTPSGSTYTVSSIPYANIPYYTVYWYDSVTNAYLGSGDSIVLTPTAPTTYKAVAVTCSDTGSTGIDTNATGYMHLMPVTSTRISTLAPNSTISIYPNPTQNVLNIAADEVITDVIVTNLVGQAVLNVQYNSRQVQVNIAALPPGIYLLKINGAVMRKFVKE